MFILFPPDLLCGLHPVLQTECAYANLLMTTGATDRKAIQFAIMPAYSSHLEIAGRVLSVSKFMKPVWLLG